MHDQTIIGPQTAANAAAVTPVATVAFGSFTSGVALTIMTRLLMLLGVVGSGAIVARWLGPEGLGALAVLNTTIVLTLSIGSLGLTTANTYFIARDRKTLGPVWANAIVFAVFGGTLVAVALVALARINPLIFGVSRDLILIAALSIPFQFLLALGLNVLLAMDRIRQLNFLDAMAPAFALFNVIVVLVILRSNLKVLVSFNTAATVAMSAVMISAIARLMARLKDGAAFRPDGQLFKSAISYGLRFCIPLMAAILIFRVDLLIVNHFRGAAEAGVYAVASQVANLLTMLPGVIAMLLLPRVASVQDPRGEFTVQVTRHVSLVMFIMCAAAAAGSPLLPLIYGPRFADATVQLLILLPGVCLIGIESVLVQHFGGTGLPLAIPVFWLITLVVNLVLNFALVPSYGALGAAMASALSYSLIFFFVAAFFCLRTGRSPAEIFLLRGQEFRDILALAGRARADPTTLSESRMKIALLVLSGDPDLAREWLRKNYPSAEIENISRGQLEGAPPLQRIRAVRSRHAHIFAIATERLVWQRGQNALLVFGVLTGASRVVLLDARGDCREEARALILARTPFRFAAEAAASALAISRSQSRLKQLEQAVKNHQNFISPKSAENLDALRIAYLRSTPSAGSAAGGAATHINGFVDAASKLGANVTVISNDYIAGLAETKLVLIGPEPLGTTRAVFDLRNNLIFSAGALREIERAPGDLIYQRYGRFTWAGVEASLRTGVPLFLEYNGSEVWIGKHWDMSGMIPLLERFERLNLEAAARIFVVSDVERRNLLRVGISEEKIVVNPNGVDTEKFRPSVGGAAVRQELGIADDETLAGFVGTFGPWHGVLTLAEAVTLLPADSRVRFLLVGAGKFHEEVERIIRAAGKDRQVIFTGHVEHERVPALLDACDILLSPHVPLEDGSEFFGSPTKLFEYMAMGKGIVASRLGQIGDVLSDQETALLTEPGNARQLADAILQLSGSLELRHDLGAAARQAAIERHTWKHNAERVLDSYRDWIEVRREK